MRTSVVFRLFLVCVAAIPVALFAQGGQAPLPVPSGQAPITPLAPEAMFTVAVAMRSRTARRGAARNSPASSTPRSSKKRRGRVDDLAPSHRDPSGSPVRCR